MGVTIHYRGSLAEPDRVENFEDRVVDVALEFGASVRIWRSADDDDPRRMVKGLIVEWSPGQESTSLLLSPEGWLIPLFEIEAAEKAELTGPPWCFVKTQFGSVEGHVALIELLAALKKEFFPDLEVMDEGGYWENRDIEALARKFAMLQKAIDGLAEGLRQHPLSSEAAEDPNILVERIVRVAKLVQRTMARPPEHPPVRFSDDDDLGDWSGVSEAQWDESFKEQRRKQERLHRAIEEQTIRGDEPGDALENAMRNEGLIDLPGEEPSPEVSEAIAELNDAAADEPWRESLPESEWSDEDDGLFDDDVGGDRTRHPLQKLAMDFYLRLHHLCKDVSDDWLSSHMGMLMGGAGDLMGGLAQALGSYHSSLDGLDRGLSLVQLKRALRGLAFSRGALYPLSADGVIDAAAFEELSATLKEIESGILVELNDIRES